MERCRRCAVGFSVFALLALGGSAHAAIDMTGRWVVGAPGGFMIWNFTQNGTALTQTPPGAGEPGPRMGTIDPTTGDFTVTDQVQCTSFSFIESCSVGGTVAPDGLTFTGAESCSGGLFCFVPPPDPLMGWRSPETCGNGVVDPGEECD